MNRAVSHPIQVDLDSPAFRTDPYPIYQTLQQEAPVYRCRDGHTYALTRYKDIATVLSDPETYSANLIGDVVGDRQPQVLILQDPPRHGVLRKSMGRAFTPKYVRQLESQIEAMASELVSDLVNLAEADFTRVVGRPLPVLVIGELIGVPIEHRDDLMRWSAGAIKGAIPAPGTAIGVMDLPMVGLNLARLTIPLTQFSARVGIHTVMTMLKQITPAVSRVFSGLQSLSTWNQRRPTLFNLHDPSFPTSMQATLEFMACVHRQVVAHRREPRETVLDTMIQMVDEGLITEWELLLNCVFFLVAGHETTVQLLNNGVLRLIEQPSLLAQLNDQPELVTNFVDEVLRHTPSLHWSLRRTTRNVEISGVSIPAQSRIVNYLGAANRDPEVFRNPEQFDIERHNSAKHLAFGRGAHYCIGASLAKTEAIAVFRQLAATVKTIELSNKKKPIPLDTSFDGGLRGYESIPIRIVPK